jgi:hypothetical protein
MNHYASIHNKSAKDILQYWAELCEDRTAPLRSAIDPMALRQHLPHLFIVQRDVAGDLTFRLAGTAICDLFGMEMRGHSFATPWDTPAREVAVNVCRNVIDTESPAIMNVAAEALNQSCAYDMLLLPIRPDTGPSDRALGTLVPVSKALPLSALPARGLSLRKSQFLDKVAGSQVSGHDTFGSIGRSLKRKLESLPLSKWLS